MLGATGSTNPKDDTGLSQCFKLKRVKMYASIAPMFMLEGEPDLLGLKRQHLSRWIMTYFPPAHGVVLAFRKLKLLGQDPEGRGPIMGKVMNDSPYAYMWIQVDFLVWSPEEGDVLDGTITVQSASHIALLIHGTFNATVKREDIPDSWSFVQADVDENDSRSLGYWMDENGQRLEGKVRFMVRSFSYAGRSVHVLGSFLPAPDVPMSMMTEEVEEAFSHNTAGALA